MYVDALQRVAWPYDSTSYDHITVPTLAFGGARDIRAINMTFSNARVKVSGRCRKWPHWFDYKSERNGLPECRAADAP
jgi:hypothetical protein